jgi:hypothetical protein
MQSNGEYSREELAKHEPEVNKWREQNDPLAGYSSGAGVGKEEGATKKKKKRKSQRKKVTMVFSLSAAE